MIFVCMGQLYTWATYKKWNWDNLILLHSVCYFLSCICRSNHFKTLFNGKWKENKEKYVTYMYKILDAVCIQHVLWLPHCNIEMHKHCVPPCLLTKFACYKYCILVSSEFIQQFYSEQIKKGLHLYVKAGLQEQGVYQCQHYPGHCTC